MVDFYFDQIASIILYAVRCEQETEVFKQEIRHKLVAPTAPAGDRVFFSLTDIRAPFGRYNGERGKAAWGLSCENDRHASMSIHIHPCPSIYVHVHTVSLYPHLFLSMSIRFYTHVHIDHPFLYVHVRPCPSFSIQVHQLSVHHPLSKSTNFDHQEQTAHCTFLQPGFEPAVHLMMDKMLEIDVDWTEGATLSFHKHKHKHKH